MREELEDVLELYEGMPAEGQAHWRERSLPSVRFSSDAEREEFIAALRERDRVTVAPTEGEEAISREAPGTSLRFQPGQRVKVNLAGLWAEGVLFSQNVEAAFATIRDQVSTDPPAYHVELLFSFRGVQELDVPADRIRPL